MASSAWRSYHIFYHGSLDRVATEVVRPAVASLLAKSCIDRFFFIRYSLGGPHIRLRLRLSAGHISAATETLGDTAESFFRRFPSRFTVPPDEIRRINRTILATDPAEHDDSVYPNQSLQEIPFNPETGRYGGSDLLDHSLDFFLISSIEALRFLGSFGEQPRGRQLMAISRLLAHQALGFAWDDEEFFSLLDYPMPTWGGPLHRVVERGDAAYEEQHESFRALLCEEIESFLASPSGAGYEAARRLSSSIRQVGGSTRLQIKSSHMHMAANRLGLTNAEEVYLSRLLSRAARDLAASEPALWTSLRQKLARRLDPSRECDRLEDLLPPMLAEAFSKASESPPANIGQCKEYDWLHFVARHDAAGQRWVEEYRSRCGEVFRQIRQSLALLRKRQITAGLASLAAAENGLRGLGALPPSLSHVMDRWYHGALAYSLYCSGDFEGARRSIDTAHRAVVAAVEQERALLPLAQTCHEFPLHKARIEYLRGHWKEAHRQIELAGWTLRGEKPLCVLSTGEEIYFGQLIEYYRQIPALNAEETAALQNVIDEELRRRHFERIVAGLYPTPVIPYP